MALMLVPNLVIHQPIFAQAQPFSPSLSRVVAPSPIYTQQALVQALVNFNEVLPHQALIGALVIGLAQQSGYLELGGIGMAMMVPPLMPGSAAPIILGRDHPAMADFHDNPKASLQRLFAERTPNQRLVLCPISLSSQEDQHLSSIGLVARQSREDARDDFRQSILDYLIQAQANPQYVKEGREQNRQLHLELSSPLVFQGQQFYRLVFDLTSNRNLSGTYRAAFVSNGKSPTLGQRISGLGALRNYLESYDLDLTEKFSVPVVFELPNDAALSRLLRAVNGRGFSAAETDAQWAQWLMTEEQKEKYDLEQQRAHTAQAPAMTVRVIKHRIPKPIPAVTQFLQVYDREITNLQGHEVFQISDSERVKFHELDEHAFIADVIAPHGRFLQRIADVLKLRRSSDLKLTLATPEFSLALLKNIYQQNSKSAEFIHHIVSGSTQQPRDEYSVTVVGVLTQDAFIGKPMIKQQSLIVYMLADVLLWRCLNRLVRAAEPLGFRGKDWDIMTENEHVMPRVSVMSSRWSKLTARERGKRIAILADLSAYFDEAAKFYQANSKRAVLGRYYQQLALEARALQQQSSLSVGWAIEAYELYGVAVLLAHYENKIAGFNPAAREAFRTFKNVIDHVWFKPLEVSPKFQPDLTRSVLADIQRSPMAPENHSTGWLGIIKAWQLSVLLGVRHEGLAPDQFVIAMRRNFPTFLIRIRMGINSNSLIDDWVFLDPPEKSQDAEDVFESFKSQDIFNNGKARLHKFHPEITVRETPEGLGLVLPPLTWSFVFNWTRSHWREIPSLLKPQFGKRQINEGGSLLAAALALWASLPYWLLALVGSAATLYVVPRVFSQGSSNSSFRAVSA